MQLILIVLVLLAFTDGERLSVEDVEPVIEELGGDNSRKIIEVLRQAEEISQALSLANQFSQNAPENKEKKERGQTAEGCFASKLEPVRAVADDEIFTALSRYFEDMAWLN